MSTSAVLQPGEGEFLSVVGERIRILADSTMTGGKYFAFEETGTPGNGPPLHRHGRDDEFFYIIEGAVKFSIDGREVTVTAGGAVRAPRGSAHAFVNLGDAPTRMLIVCCPGGLEGPFREVDALERAGRATLEAIAAAFQKFDVEIVGPPLAP